MRKTGEVGLRLHLQIQQLQGVDGMLLAAVCEEPFFFLGQALQQRPHLHSKN